MPKEAEAIVRTKIIKSAASKRNFSVAGECNVEEKTQESGRSKESMWKRYENDEKALSWVKLTQVEIDKIWSRLAKDMEERVLTRYIVKTEARYKGRGTPLMWVHQTSESGRRHG